MANNMDKNDQLANKAGEAVDSIGEKVDEIAGIKRVLAARELLEREDLDPEIRATMDGVLEELSRVYAENEVLRKDALTGLTCQTAFRSISREVFKNLQHDRRKMSYALADIDHFKRINDTYGHAAGDFVLAEVSKLIGFTSRGSDVVVARDGGEEFSFILLDVQLDGAAIFAERLRKNIEGHRFKLKLDKGDVVIPVTLSVGVAERVSFDSDFVSLKNRADAALYKAKRESRNAVFKVAALEGKVNYERVTAPVPVERRRLSNVDTIVDSVREDVHSVEIPNRI